VSSRWLLNADYSNYFSLNCFSNREVGENLIVPGGTKTIDAKGKYVMPGGIDTHTHMEFYFMGTRTADDFYTGTRAALAGGTTMIMNFVLENRDMSLVEAYDLNKERALKKACCDFAFHSAVFKYDDKVAKEMEILAKEKGVNSFKCFMAYKVSTFFLLHKYQRICRGLYFGYRLLTNKKIQFHTIKFKNTQNLNLDLT
jgi:dihydroorotase-like cyclic amidohydrolase